MDRKTAEVIAIISALAMLATGLLWLGDAKTRLDFVRDVHFTERLIGAEADIRDIKEELGMVRSARDHFGE